MQNKIILFALFIFSQFTNAKLENNLETVLTNIVGDYPNIRDFTLNNTQDEAYFTAQSHLSEISVIMQVVKKKDEWQKPTIASFSGKHHDLEPFLSVDNKKLYFASKRPNLSGSEANYDIWYVQRKTLKDKWSSPINIGPEINSKHNEFYPSLAGNQNLYFTSNKEDSKGKDDIYFSEYLDGNYQTSYSLSKAINTDGDEYNAYISNDESYLIFGAYNRQDGKGSGDLYITYKNKDNSWSPALNFPEPINSKYMDYCPFVIENTLYFTSRRSDYNLEEFKVSSSKELLKQLNKQSNGRSRIYKSPLSKILPKYQSHDFPKFLIGTWKIEGKDSYEHWQLDENSNLKGSSYKLIDGKEKTSETLMLKKQDDSFVYSATVFDQNEGKTIDFNLNNTILNKYVFENTAHDFPNQISYELISEGQVFVLVSGNDGNGYSFKMNKEIEKKQIPEWFLSDLEKNIGIWTADNSRYKSENETQDQYVINWQWGIGKTNITGKLYGYINGNKTPDYWQFRQYWDNVSGKAMFVQYGFAGVQGIGEIIPNEEGQIEMIQTFSNPSSQTWKIKHISQNDGEKHQNSSWTQTNEGNWKLDREYIWYKSDE
jgi:hypothetical protein